MSFDPIAYINEPRWLESRLGLDRICELLDWLGRPVSYTHLSLSTWSFAISSWAMAFTRAASVPVRMGNHSSGCPELVSFRR